MTNNYQYRPLTVTAWQNIHGNTSGIPTDLQIHIIHQSEGICLKNPLNPGVLKPIEKGYWVVKDVTVSPQIQIYSDSQFQRRFQIMLKNKPINKYGL